MNTYVLLSKLSNDNKDIQKNIINEVKSLKPKLLYVPAASNDSDINAKHFKEKFKGLSVDIIIARLTTNCTDDIIKMMDETDIIFFGGGNTVTLLNLLKKHKLNEYLLKLENKVICGLSAGAIMLCNYGIGDSVAYYDKYKLYNYNVIKGISLLNIGICPHFDTNELIEFNDIVKQYNINAFSIEDETALFFKDNKVRIVSNCSGKTSYYYLKNNDFIMKEMKGELTTDDNS